MQSQRGVERVKVSCTYDGDDDDKDTRNDINNSTSPQAHSGWCLSCLVLLENTSASDQQRNDRSGIRDVEEDSARSNVSTESHSRTKIQKPKEDVENETQGNCADGDIELRFNVCKVVMADDTLVSSHGVEKTTRTGDAG